MSVQGATLYSDPNGTEWVFVVAGGQVYATGEGRVSRQISTNGATVTGLVSFTQCYGNLLLWRGTGAAPLQMETLDAGFVEVTQTTSGAGEGTGTQVIPNSDGARFFQNRVFVPFIYTGSKKDFVAVGDIGNYTRYKFPQNAFRFNDGADDDIVDIAPFGRTSLIVFKQKSVRIVDNLVPDAAGDYSAAVSDIVTSTHGLVARGAWVTVGRDLYYVSTKGVTSLQLTEENRVKGVDLPLSAALSVTWDRINWRLRSQIRIGYWDNKLYVALPLDDARVVSSTNLATGSYNIVTGQLTLDVTPGQVYFFEFGTAETLLTNGAQTLTRSGFFTAQTLTVTFEGTPGAATTATLNHVPFYDCNNAVAVFDFVNRAWSGVDKTDYVTHVQEFITPNIQGRQRLVAVTPDGLLRLWEEGYEDERLLTVSNPYVDITVESQPATGKTIRLGGGTNVSASTATGSNGSSTWGTVTVALARTNLYSGFNTLWTEPGGTVTQQDWGIRWTSASSTLPALVINGVNIYNSGLFDWAYVNIISGTQITPQSVELTFTTRGYTLNDPDGKRYQQADLVMRTWNPTYSVTGVADGVNETTAVATNRTRSRTAYTIAAAAWDATNTNNDHGNPWRQDYSVTLSTGFNLGSGVNLGLHQEMLEKLRVEQRGNALQLTFTNTTGRAEVKSVTLSGVPGDRTAGTKLTG